MTTFKQLFLDKVCFQEPIGVLSDGLNGSCRSPCVQNTDPPVPQHGQMVILFGLYSPGNVREKSGHGILTYPTNETDMGVLWVLCSAGLLTSQSLRKYMV